MMGKCDVTIGREVFCMELVSSNVRCPMLAKSSNVDRDGVWCLVDCKYHVHTQT